MAADVVCLDVKPQSSPYVAQLDSSDSDIEALLDVKPHKDVKEGKVKRKVSSLQ